MTTDRDRADIETAIRAFPWWPFNRGPFVKFGVWYVSRALLAERCGQHSPATSADAYVREPCELPSGHAGWHKHGPTLWGKR